ncbi:MAG TPA: polysaccharide pyruvyl transferase family protein [Candidatus Sulfotelmatobacter sp.]|nr:polysaccharide pyruvyl transferase family protein [Candidatus Sulfotelmatobacter sp.]
MSTTVRQVQTATTRIALLTPYSGGNLGDAAIQDALITNLRLQMPGARFAGISLNSENFIERHGVEAFPLCTTSRHFYAMSNGSVSGSVLQQNGRTGNRNLMARLKDALKRKPRLVQCLKDLRQWFLLVPKELLHVARGYRFIGRQDILIVAGGGQLDEEWGGPWGHPFALLKWAMLARMARVPCAFVSVGAGKMKSPVSRLFLSLALRLACYRSYRDRNSKRIAATLFRAAVDDPIVPDLAFGLPVSEIPADAGIRSLSRSRTVVAISPIAYGKPASWPNQDQGLYSRYVQQMAQLIARLAERDYFLVMVWSSLGDDESVIPQIFERLDETSRKKLADRLYLPSIRTWKELVGLLHEVDFLVASRLHSAILGFVTLTPTVAISFDPKVDWVMEDISQTDCLLHIDDFKAEDVLNALDHIRTVESTVTTRISSYQLGIRPAVNRQYDALAELASESQLRKN